MPLVPLITNSSPAAGLYAPAGAGGGGGGGGANPAFSTITMANPGSYSNVWSPTQGYINWASTLIFAQISNNQGNIYFAQGTNDTTDTSIIINSQNNGANLFLGASDVIDGTFIRSEYNKPLQLLAPTFVSSLNVSSINGAAPGGAVAPDIVVSSITFPNSQIDANSGIKFSTILQLNDTNTSNASDFFFVAGQAEPYLANVSTNVIQINAPSGVGAILSLEAANNSTSMIIAEDTTNTLRPLEVVAASLNTSSINVNALNNQKAPQNVAFSSISLTGNPVDAFAVDGTQNWFQSVGGMGILNVILPVSSSLLGANPSFKYSGVIEPPIPGVFTPTNLDVKHYGTGGTYITSNWERTPSQNSVNWTGWTSTGTISSLAISITGYSQIF